MLRLIANLTRGHFRSHKVELALCLIGVALGVAVLVGIELAVAASVRSFEGAVTQLMDRATHSIRHDRGHVTDEEYIDLVLKRWPEPLAPVIDRRVIHAADDGVETLVRLIGVDPFAERQMRTVTRVQDDLPDDAFDRFMTDPQAVVLVQDLADTLGVTQGDALTFTTGQSRHAMRVLGVIEVQGAARSQIGDLAIVDLATAQEMAGSLGKIDRIDTILPGIDGSPEREAALAQLEAKLPPGFFVRSTQQQASSLEELVEAYRLNLNALSLMASFVAVFIVYNAMLVSVRQRIRQLAVLRCLGGSRWQLSAVYLQEAVVFAAVGGVLGVAGGWGLAHVLVGQIGQTISDLYAVVDPGAVVLDARTAVLGLAVSFGSASVGAAVPLWQAGRTPPISVLRASDVAGRSREAARAFLLAGVGLLLLTGGLYFVPGESPLVGFVMAVTLALGFAFCCPAVTRLACAVVARAGRAGQLLPTQMAAGGVARSLGVTGVAVAAMMLALSMSVGIQTMVGSFRDALGTWLDNRFKMDVFVGPQLLVDYNIESDLDPAAVDWVINRPEVSRHVIYRWQMGVEIAGVSTQLLAAEMPKLVDRDLQYKHRIEGPYDATTQVVVSEPFAAASGTQAGDTLTLNTPAGPREFLVYGVFYDFGSERGQVMIDLPVYRELYDDPAVTSVHVALAPGEDAEAVARKWQSELGIGYPVVVQSYQTLKAEVLTIFNRTFAVTDVLSWLAGGVAFCGLAGSLLALSLARSREYGVLAALGMSTRQTATLVVVEGLIIAVVAAAVAAVAGTALAYVLSYVIQYRSFGWSIPTSPRPAEWLSVLLLSCTAALLAAAYPVKRLLASPPAAALRSE
ncbi:MAG: FtsX-like permease family protein [Phycisphaerae bacterium]